MKRNLLQAVWIIALAVLIGIFYNYSNPSKLPFIGEEKKIDFSQSDSLMIALRIQDSIHRVADSLRNISLRYNDSLNNLLEQKKNDSLKLIKQDSLKRINDSLKVLKQKQEDTLKNTQNNKQNFIKPVDIKLDFAKALFDKKYRFIDARDESDYQAGSIRNSLNVPFHHIEQNKHKLESLDREAVYVCYCSSTCDVSIDLAYYMAKMGFKKVYIFHGGWDEWNKAGYPTGG